MLNWSPKAPNPKAEITGITELGGPETLSGRLTPQYSRPATHPVKGREPSGTRAVRRPRGTTAATHQRRTAVERDHAQRAFATAHPGPTNVPAGGNTTTSSARLNPQNSFVGGTGEPLLRGRGVPGAVYWLRSSDPEHHRG